MDFNTSQNLIVLKALKNSPVKTDRTLELIEKRTQIACKQIKQFEFSADLSEHLGRAPKVAAQYRHLANEIKQALGE